MFDIAEYGLTHESTKYTCSIIRAPFVEKCIGILYNKDFLLYLVFSEKDPEKIFQMSFKTSPERLQYAKQLLCSAIAQLKIPGPFCTEEILPVTLQLLQTVSQDHMYIRTQYHMYRVNVKENMYNYYVTVGGRTFQKCMELFLYKSGDSTLAQIYSEPECSVDSFLRGGDETVDMIKGVLQLCELLFGIREVSFHDASEIDCGTKEPAKPIGKRTTKSFSLTHLSIINRCKTWYESHFGATLKDPNAQSHYIQGLSILNQPIHISLEELAKDPTTHLSDEQIHALAPFFSSSKTWIQFLRSVPKEKQCTLLNWSHSYLDKLMKFQPRNHDWVIHLNTPTVLEFPFAYKNRATVRKNICEVDGTEPVMTPTLMIPLGFAKQKGGIRSHISKTRKSSSRISFHHTPTPLHI